MVSEQIGDSQFTINWLTELLENDCNITSSLLQWDTKTIGIGQGYCSSMILVHLQWKDNDDNKLPNSVVLKIPNLKAAKEVVGCVESSDFDNWLLFAHSVECIAYDSLSLTSVHLPVPKVYYSRPIQDSPGSGIIVMENLSHGSIVNFIDGLNLEQMMSVAESLAQLHAHCLKLNPGWNTKLQSEVQGSMDIWMKILNGILDDAKSKMKDVRPDFHNNVLANALDKFDVKQFCNWIFHLHEELGMAPVIVEGDCWTNNILFFRQGDTIGSKVVAILDWQTAHPGSCMEDLACLLATSCSGELRRKEWRNLIEHYYQTLVQIMGSNTPFTLDQVLEAFQKIQPMAMYFMLVSSCPMWPNLPEVANYYDPDKALDILVERATMIVEDVYPECISK